MSDTLKGQGQCDVVPLVTIGMPVYNAGHYLRLAVMSIVNQIYTNWELLLIDDGSTDNSLQYIADITDSRIRVLHDGKNKGLAARLNECIDLARGKYFARMDQDDIAYPDRFEQQVIALNNDLKLDLVSVRSITIDENNIPTGCFPARLMHKEICSKPWLGFYFPHPTWMGRIEWFRKYRYCVPGPYLCEDQELLLRSYSESKFETVNRVLFAYRVRGSIELLKSAKNRWSVLNVQIRHFTKLKSWLLSLLSIYAFFMRLIKDVVNKAGVGGFKSIKNTICSNEISNWDSVLEELVKISRSQ